MIDSIELLEKKDSYGKRKYYKIRDKYGKISEPVTRHFVSKLYKFRPESSIVEK